MSLVVWLNLGMSAWRDFVDLFHIHDLFDLEGRFDCLRVSEDICIISALGAGKNANLTIFVHDVMLSLFFCGFSCHNAKRHWVYTCRAIFGAFKAVLMTIQVFRNVLRLYRWVSTTELVTLSLSCYHIESPMREKSLACKELDRTAYKVFSFLSSHKPHFVFCI